MKKIKLTSIIVLIAMIFNAIIMPIIAKAEEITSSSVNGYNVVFTNASIGANVSVSDVNDLIVRNFFKMDDVSTNVRDFKSAGENIACLGNNKVDLDDPQIFRNFMFLFCEGKYGAINVYNEMKNYLEASDLQIVATLSNGEKTLTAEVDNGNNAKSFWGSEFESDDVYRSICEYFGDEYGNTYEAYYGTTDKYNIELDNIYSIERTMFDKKINQQILFIVDGEQYNFVYGYYTNSKNDKGIYNVNAYLVYDNQEPAPGEFATTLDYEAYIGTKDVGGTVSEGTYLPNYDKENEKEDADVTAIIKSTTDEKIKEVNGVELKNDGTPYEDGAAKGWYYIDPDDQKVIAKQYKFDDYDNSTDNGMVEEVVELKSSEGNKSTQNVSIKWPFRIIDVTYDPEKITEDTDKVTVTIETNLPMDPQKIPDGWELVENTDNHKITRTFKKGEDIDKDVTVYQNGTKDSDTTNVKIDWPDGKKDNTVAPTPHPKTGETFTILLVVAIIITFAVITRKKSKLK